MIYTLSILTLFLSYVNSKITAKSAYSASFFGKIEKFNLFTHYKGKEGIDFSVKSLYYDSVYFFKN